MMIAAAIVGRGSWVRIRHDGSLPLSPVLPKLRPDYTQDRAPTLFHSGEKFNPNTHIHKYKYTVERSLIQPNL